MRYLFNGHFFVLLLFLLSSIVLSQVFFSGLKSNEFLYIGDQLLRLNYFDSLTNSFQIRKWENFGVHNGWQFTVQFWDAAFYNFVYFFRLPVQFVERLLFLVTLFFSLVFSYIGFYRWTIFLNKKSYIAAAVVAFWYCFNPYPVMLWHGGAYILGVGITYSLAPLLFYLFYIGLFKDSNYKSLFLLSLVTAVSFFVFWLFAPLAVALVLFFVFAAIFHIKEIQKILFRAIIYAVITLLLTAPSLFAITHELFSNVADVNSDYTPTFGNQQGGFLYMFLFLFSWGIYTVWTPRSLYPFYQFYFSQQYLWGIIIMYVGVLSGSLWFLYKLVFEKIKTAVRTKPDYGYLLLLFVVIFSVSIFFAKGAQEPYADIFIYLFENVPFFSVFRTPDIRFAFTIVLSLGLIMIFISRYIHRLVFSVLLILLVFLQSSIFLNGLAVKGENVPAKFFDRVVHVPVTYHDLNNSIMQNATTPVSYVFPYPSYENGKYLLDSDHFVGQDLLPRVVERPFVYLSESSGIAKNSYSTLKNIFEQEQYEKLSELPIEFLVIRRDVECAQCKQLDEVKLNEYFKLLLHNRDFDLYQVKSFRPLLSGNISEFKIINPTFYTVTTDSSLGAEIVLGQNYNENWKVYSVPSFFLINSFLVQTPLADLFFDRVTGESHYQYAGYGNRWIFDTESYKTDHFAIVYQPQGVYGLLLILSFILSGCLVLSLKYPKLFIRKKR